MSVVQPPSNFVDRHPERGAWSDPHTHPAAYSVVELLFADGTSKPGSWNGTRWSCGGKTVAPMGWRETTLRD